MRTALAERPSNTDNGPPPTPFNPRPPRRAAPPRPGAAPGRRAGSGPGSRFGIGPGLGRSRIPGLPLSALAHGPRHHRPVRLLCNRGAFPAPPPADPTVPPPLRPLPRTPMSAIGPAPDQRPRTTRRQRRSLARAIGRRHPPRRRALADRRFCANPRAPALTIPPAPPRRSRGAGPHLQHALL